MVKFSKKEALNKIREICEVYKVPITFYDDGGFPDGAQGSENVVSINRKNTKWVSDGDEVYWHVEYQPWIRVIPNDLTVEKFDEILTQGEKVRECVIELNEFFENKKVIEDLN